LDNFNVHFLKTKLNMKRILLLSISFLFVLGTAWAQRTVSGSVTSDSDGSGIPGVNVVLKGTTTGTTTDLDGNYRLSVPEEGGTLVFSFIGLSTQEVEIGARSVVNVSMSEDVETLGEVIVTAQGIAREKQALGYSVSNVSAENLEQRSESDIARVLNGKASGVQIQQQSGMSGSGTSIIIRGMSSFSGTNQPLFIVDGIPFSSQTNNQGNFEDGNNGSSRFLDLDPNNIESVSVLKGLAAATLYGTQGRNGVILITTKSGSSKGAKKKTEVTVASSVFANEIASMPEYQNEYGGGFDQSFGWFFSNWGPAFAEGGPAGWGSQSSIFVGENGGPVLRHPYSTASAATGVPAAFPEFANAEYDWKPYSSVPDFFRRGRIVSNSINVKGASDDGNYSYNASFGNLNDEGFTPGNNLTRNTFSVGGRAKLTNNFTINGTMNYANTDFETPPVAAGYGSNVSGENASIFANLFYTPRSVDLMGLPYQNPVDGSSVYYRQGNDIQNPRWTVDNAKNIQKTHRVFGGISAMYALNDNLNASFRYGYDTYSENNVNYANKGGKTGSVANQSGVYQTWNNTNTIQDYNAVVNGNYEIGQDFDVTFAVGATARRDVFERNGVNSVGQQVFGVLRHFNFASQDERQYFEERNILGLYGQAEVGYKKFAYLTLAGRKDWVSNLAEENRSIVYPSGSISFLPFNAIAALGDIDAINLFKIRVGYGTSANFPTGYPIASTLYLDTQDFQDDAGTDVVANTTGEVLGNPDLKPESMGELEFGIEAAALDNRLSLDFSVYNRTTTNLIVDRPLDPSTGFIETQTNVGEIITKGAEIDLGYDWFRNRDGFSWNTSLNWFRAQAEVTDLGLDTDIVIYAGFTNQGNAAIEGELLGAMIGSRVGRDESGNLLVNAAGSYVIDEGNHVIGNATPDFTSNIINTFSYKGVSLNVLFSWVQGGDIYAQTVQTLLGRGVINDEGVDRANSFILPGVNPSGETNTTQINNSTYYFSNVLYGPVELGVYDATVFRLQELSLSYRLPNSLLDKTPFGMASLTFTGNNLWFHTPNMPENANFDPNVAGLGVGNGAGWEYLNGPSSRRYGLSLKASF
jgi:TonB-linked SusC/RagA family outer membrane protein